MVDFTPAIEIIKRFEGITDGDPTTVNLDPYLCPAGYWTIGWGHVVRDVYGKMIKGRENKLKAKAIYPYGISKEQAHEMLVADIRRVWVELEQVLYEDGTIFSLNNNNQLCALISFVFNIGVAAFKQSMLLQRLREGSLGAVPDQLKRWNKAGGKVLAGLKRRRAAEAELWLTPEGSA